MYEYANDLCRNHRQKEQERVKRYYHMVNFAKIRGRDLERDT